MTRAQYQRAYRDGHRTEHNARCRAWCKKHPEDAVRRRRRSKSSHKRALAAARTKRYRKNHPEYLIKQRAMTKKNRVKILAQRRAFRKKNSYRYIAYTLNRNARVHGNGGSWMASEFTTMCADYNQCCACCGEQRALQPDHIIAVSKAGKNVIGNLQPLCGRCNTSKGAKTGAYTCICGRRNLCASQRLSLPLLRGARDAHSADSV